MESVSTAWERGLLRFTDLWKPVVDSNGELRPVNRNLRWLGSSNSFLGDELWELAGVREVGWSIRNTHSTWRNAWRPSWATHVLPAIPEGLLTQAIKSGALERLYETDHVVLEDLGYVRIDDE